MARLQRLSIAKQHHYVMQRGNNFQPVFCDEDDYREFLNWLQRGAQRFSVAIHAYVLLPDAVHLLLTPQEDAAISGLMQWLGRYYVPYFNRKYRRAGTLFQGRYKATVIQPQPWFITCSQYIETLPVLARLAQQAGDYSWSSYAHHAGLTRDPVVTDGEPFWALGNTPFEREAHYRDTLQAGLGQRAVQTLCDAVEKGWALGDVAFLTEMERRTERRLRPARPGRPRKVTKDVAEHE